jgi:hypothetical protein
MTGQFPEFVYSEEMWLRIAWYKQEAASEPPSPAAAWRNVSWNCQVTVRGTQ